MCLIVISSSSTASESTLLSSLVSRVTALTGSLHSLVTALWRCNYTVQGILVDRAQRERERERVGVGLAG